MEQKTLFPWQFLRDRIDKVVFRKKTRSANVFFTNGENIELRFTGTKHRDRTIREATLWLGCDWIDFED